MDRVTSKEIIKNLIDVGYTLSEISKYTTILVRNPEGQAKETRAKPEISMRSSHQGSAVNEPN